MSFEFSIEPAFQEQLDWMREFMREEVWVLEAVEREMTEAAFFGRVRELQDEVRRRGLWATHLAPEHGGQGWGQVQLALMHEIEGSSIWWGPIVFGNQAPDSGNSEILALWGSEEQKRRWLVPLLAGEIRSAFSMTEAFTAGADPTGLACRAELDGDEWVITGEKWFTSNGMIADVLIVMAVTDPEAPPHGRASMFVVPAHTPGVNRVRNIGSLEAEPPFGYGHAEIVYDDVRVPADALLGRRGDGFKVAQSRLGPGRIHHCMRWLGQSQRALDILCERALQRELFGERLADKQTVQNWIADSVAEMHAARLVTLHAAWVIDTAGAQAARKEIAMIKFFGTHVMYNVIDRAIQACGSLGYSSDLPLESMYRFARASRIYDGPDEVHRRTVARLELRDHKAPVGPFPTDHLPTRRAAARQKLGLASYPGSVGIEATATATAAAAGTAGGLR
jgi:acyl-CoA dehydrogenase